jgi:two-component system phosphate regulon response regulator OmpR
MKEQETIKSSTYANLPHILVVDDDIRIRDLIARYLHEHGFLVMTAPDAAAARDILAQFSFDALVIDVMMPGEGGLNLTRFVRSDIQTPVILLTALGGADDRIKGLESGADDYLAKPFEPRELVLRLEALIRRTASAPPHKNQPISVGDWHFDPIRKTLQKDNQVLHLTTGEVTLLQVLYEHAGKVIRRADLATACDADPNTRSIDVQITRLRQKLEEDTRRPRYLQTVRGKGYVLYV